jgi:hypothetical protein
VWPRVEKEVRIAQDRSYDDDDGERGASGAMSEGFESSVGRQLWLLTILAAFVLPPFFPQKFLSLFYFLFLRFI